MFNKTSVFGRNETRSDTLARRDALSSGTAAGAAQKTTADRTATRIGSSNEAATAKPVPTLTAVAPARNPSSPANSIDAAASIETSAQPNNQSSSDNEEATNNARLIVGSQVKLRGAEILDCDTLVVEGRVEATMDSRVIRIAEGGSFSGKVSIDVAVIHGSFEGELTARSQLIIHSTGRVNGTIRYGKLVAEEGAELCGDIGLIGSVQAKQRSGDSSSPSDPRASLGLATG